MRDLDNRDLITGDFVFITGDVISNLDLEPVLARHRARREKDKNAIMTMVLRESGKNHRTKSKARRSVFVINPAADRCLHYEEIGLRKRGSHYVTLDPYLLKEHGEIEIREDLIDCHIDICTPDVLAQWTDNFDYQALRSSFLFGVLKDYELNGKTIHAHVLKDQYAARVKNLRAYDAISKDVTGRWSFPFTPDSNLLPGANYRLGTGKNYLERGVNLAQTSALKGRNVIGTDTIIGKETTIVNSIIGQRCRIGQNAHISNAYLWDDVTVGNNTTVSTSIIANSATIGNNCAISPVSLLSFSAHVPDNSQVSGATVTQGKESSTFTPYVPDSDSDASDTTFSHLLYANPSATSSTSSISTLTSQISDDRSADPETSTSRRSSVFSDPEDADAAQKNRDFLLEATSSILDGLAKGDAAETIFLELNGYRMSVDATQHAVRSSVVSAFMKRIAQLTDSGTSPREAVNALFTKYKALVDRVILDKAVEEKGDQVDFLLCIQKEIVGRPKAGELLLFVAKQLYDLDLVEEDGVLQWWEDERGEKGDMGGIRGLTEQFVMFLKEAEEDDDEEEEEEEGD